MTPVKEGPVLVLRRGLDLETRIALTEFRGEHYVDFRVWWLPPGEKEFKPTKKGVSIPMENLDRVMEVLHEIEQREATNA